MNDRRKNFFCSTDLLMLTNAHLQWLYLNHVFLFFIQFVEHQFKRRRRLHISEAEFLLPRKVRLFLFPNEKNCRGASDLNNQR